MRSVRAAPASDLRSLRFLLFNFVSKSVFCPCSIRGCPFWILNFKFWICCFMWLLARPPHSNDQPAQNLSHLFLVSNRRQETVVKQLSTPRCPLDKSAPQSQTP